MVSIHPDSLTLWLAGFFVLAALGATLALAMTVDLVAGARRTRLARRQGVRSYYRGLVLAR